MVLAIAPQFIMCIGLIVGGALIAIDAPSSLSLSRGTFIILASFMVGSMFSFSVSFLFVQSLLGRLSFQHDELTTFLDLHFRKLSGTIDTCISRLEGHLAHLFGAHTKELKECIEGQLASNISRVEQHLTHLFDAHTNELKECIEGQLVSNISRVEQHLTHLFDAHTNELKECIEAQLHLHIERVIKQTEHLFSGHGGGLDKFFKALQKDVAILSDILEKNTQVYIKRTEDIAKVLTYQSLDR